MSEMRRLDHARSRTPSGRERFQRQLQELQRQLARIKEGMS